MTVKISEKHVTVIVKVEVKTEVDRHLRSVTTHNTTTNSSLCNFLQPPVTSTQLVPNIHISLCSQFSSVFRTVLQL
jgi:hypothetical protein